MKARQAFLLLGCVVATALSADARNSSQARRELDTTSWGNELHQSSLIIAQVTALGAPAVDSRWYPMMVKPLATLSGGFDPGEHPELDVPFHFVRRHADIYPIRRRPEVGDIVMAIITKREDGYTIDPNFFSFMPGDSPLVIISGLDDPRVMEVLTAIQQEEGKAATRPAAQTDLTLIRHGRASFGERLRIAATSADAKVLNLLADFDEPFEVQLLVVMNFNTRAGIVKAYTDLPQDVIDRFEHSEHEILRAAAEWNLANRPDPTAKPATRPADNND